MATKAQKDARTVRECVSKWEYNGTDGKVETAEIGVFYFSPTIAQLKKQRAEAKARYDKDSTDIYWLSEELLPLLHSLSDLPGTAAPSPLTVEWLDEQDITNLSRIKAAITEDIELGKPKSA